MLMSLPNIHPLRGRAPTVRPGSMTLPRAPGIAAVALLLCGCTPAVIEKMPRMERDLRLAAERESPGVHLSLWLSQADGRELLALEADRPIPAASVNKILILVEAHAQAIDGRFAWTDNHTLLAT